MTCSRDGVYLSPLSLEADHAEVAVMANRLLLSALKSYEFFYSGFVVNYDSVSLVHRDSNNIGPSILLLLGSFSGRAFSYDGVLGH